MPVAFALLRPVGAHVLYPDVVRLLSEDEENRSESDAFNQSFGCCEGLEVARRGPGPRGGRRAAGRAGLKVVVQQRQAVNAQERDRIQDRDAAPGVQLHHTSGQRAAAGQCGRRRAAVLPSCRQC